MKYGTAESEILPEIKGDLHSSMKELVMYYDYLYYEDKLDIESCQVRYRDFLKSVFDQLSHFEEATAKSILEEADL